jgi:hypothetical protein
MFSHVVVFWTRPGAPRATEELLAGLERLKDIPGITHFHVGRMAPSDRPVVERSYQVALYVGFPDRAAHDAYQTHPLHREFLEEVFPRVCARVVVYDFE